MHPSNITLDSEAGALEWAQSLGASFQGGEVVCLTGPLGSGKTVLARGMARGLGYMGRVTSPSYSIVHEYSGRLRVYHLDLFRLDATADWDEIGLDHYLSGRGVCLVEWPERYPELTSRADFKIELQGVGQRPRRAVLWRRG